MSVWNYGQTKEKSQEMWVNETLILVLPKAVARKRSSFAGATWLYWKQRRMLVMGNLHLSSSRVWLCWCTEWCVFKACCSSGTGKEIGLVSDGAVQCVGADPPKPLYSWTGETKYSKGFMSWVSDRERSLTKYHHGQNRLKLELLTEFTVNKIRAR